MAVKQTNELIREKEHVDISDTAKFQSSGPNAGEMVDINLKKPENKRQLYGSQAWVDPPPYICLLF